MRETDLATGTFYNYFDSKEAVFTALIEELAEKARERVRAGRRDGPDRRGAHRGPRYFALVLEERELFEVFRRYAGVIAAMADRDWFADGERDLLEDLLAWAQAGEMPDVDLRLLAQAMFGAGVHVANHLVDEDAPDVDAAAHFCAKLFLGGVRALA